MVEAALAAMAKGEVDCIFPVNLDGYDGETRNMLITPSLIRTDMYAVVRSADQKIFDGKEHVEDTRKHHHQRTGEVALVPDHDSHDDARDHREKADDDLDTQEHELQLARQGTDLFLFLLIHNQKYKKTRANSSS